MAFFNVFLRTLGFLVGIATFIILLNIFLSLLPNNKEAFNFVKGDKNSQNISPYLSPVRNVGNLSVS